MGLYTCACETDEVRKSKTAYGVMRILFTYTLFYELSMIESSTTILSTDPSMLTFKEESSDILRRKEDST